MDSLLTYLLCSILLLPSLYAIPEIEVLHSLEPLKERFLSRVVRQSNKACCGSVPLKSGIITDLAQVCTDELGDLQKQDQVPCLCECAGRKLGVVDDDGYIKVEEFVKLCQRMTEGDKKLQEHIINVCINEAERTQEIPENVQSQFKCRLDMVAAFQGTDIELLLHCPSNMKNYDAECEKKRDYVVKKLKQSRASAMPGLT